MRAGASPEDDSGLALDMSADNDRHTHRILTLLARLGYVEEKEERWRFTGTGHTCLVACTQTQTRGPRLLSIDLTQPPSEMSTYALLKLLQANGWSHEQASRSAKKRARVPQNFIGDDKRWFTFVWQKTVSHFYLLALATFDDHKRPVPHLKKEHVYISLLQGEEAPHPKPKRTRLLEEDAVNLHAAPTSRQRAAHRRGSAHNVAQLAPDLPGPDADENLGSELSFRAE